MMRRPVRTTVTLDDDLFAKLKDDAHERGVPFKTAINEAVREGLRRPAPAVEPVEPFRVKPRSMGTWPGVNMDKALQIAFAEEDEEKLRRMRLHDR
jgi:hypothetical protein